MDASKKVVLMCPDCGTEIKVLMEYHVSQEISKNALGEFRMRDGEIEERGGPLLCCKNCGNNHLAELYPEDFAEEYPDCVVIDGQESSGPVVDTITPTIAVFRENPNGLRISSWLSEYSLAIGTNLLLVEVEVLRFRREEDVLELHKGELEELDRLLTSIPDNTDYIEFLWEEE